MRFSGRLVIARGAIWVGLACNLLVAIINWLVGIIPGAVFDPTERRTRQFPA